MSEGVSSQRATDWLTKAGLAYLALPNFVFLLSWVNPFIGIPVSLALFACLFRAVMKAGDSSQPAQPTKASAMFAVLLVSTAWAAFGGAGHIGFANRDWLTRDAVYGDLIRYSWPVVYQMPDGSQALLRTAMAYYLPAAAVVKEVGLQFADVALFLWTATGAALFLAALPVPRSRGGWGWVASMLLVVMFGGMDVLAFWIYHQGYWPLFPEHLEWWTIRFQYSSLSTQLFWVPNHALPAWIAAALYFRHWKQPDYPDQGVLTLALLPLWSPFAAIGFAPFLGWRIVRSLRDHHALGFSSSTAIVCLLVCGICARVLTSGAGEIAHGLPLLPSLTASPVAEFLSVYGLFVLAEFGALVLILGRIDRAHTDLRRLSAIVLMLLPFMQLGPANDLVMRASIPALAILCLICVDAMTTPRDARTSILVGLPLAAVVALSAVTAIHEMGRAVVLARWPANYALSFREQSLGRLPAHYVGRYDGGALEWLLRRPETVN